MEVAEDEATFRGQSPVDSLHVMPTCDVNTVIVDCTTMGYVDYNGVDTLSTVSSGRIVLSVLCQCHDTLVLA